MKISSVRSDMSYLLHAAPMQLANGFRSRFDTINITSLRDSEAKE